MAPTAEQLLALAVKQIEDNVPEGDLPAATLARRIGLPYQRVYRWFKTNGPDYEGAMAILEAFGWLSIAEDDRAEAGIPPDPLHALAEKVAELARGQALIAASLGIQLGRDAPDEVLERPTQVRPKPKGIAKA